MSNITTTLVIPRRVKMIKLEKHTILVITLLAKNFDSTTGSERFNEYDKSGLGDTKK